MALVTRSDALVPSSDLQAREFAQRTTLCGTVPMPRTAQINTRRIGDALGESLFTVESSLATQVYIEAFGRTIDLPKTSSFVFFLSLLTFPKLVYSWGSLFSQEKDTGHSLWLSGCPVVIFFKCPLAALAMSSDRVRTPCVLLRKVNFT